jgi:hypothetical protein
VLKRILLPLLIGLLAVGQVVTGLVGASSIRADQKHAREVAAEKRAVAAYRKAAGPVVLTVFDAIQPLQDAYDAFNKPRAGLIRAQVDTIRSGAAGTALASAKKTLDGLRAPKTLKDAAARLTAGLSQLRTAESGLVAATRAKTNAFGFSSAISDGYDKLSSAEASWNTAAGDVFGGAPLSLPSIDRALAQGRKVPTRAGFIHAADLVCAANGERVDALPEVGSVELVRDQFPKLAGIIRDNEKQLRTLHLPAADATLQHRITVQLGSASQLPAQMEVLSSALKRHDLAAYTASERRFDAALAASSALAKAFKDLGVTSCYAFYNVDSAGSSSGTGDAKA